MSTCDGRCVQFLELCFCHGSQDFHCICFSSSFKEIEVLIFGSVPMTDITVLNPVTSPKLMAARITSTWVQSYYLHEIRLTKNIDLLESKYFTRSIPSLIPATVIRHEAFTKHSELRYHYNKRAHTSKISTWAHRWRHTSSSTLRYQMNKTYLNPYSITRSTRERKDHCDSRSYITSNG